MDPVSITGLVGTCISLVANTAKTIKNLNDLKSKFSEVAVEIARLLSQVSTIQASVQLIQKWLDRGPAALHANADLKITIEQALDDCIVIISALERHVFRIAYADGIVPVQGKIRHVFGEEELATNQRALGYQVQALTLLLQAIHITSVVEQQQLLAREETQAVLRRARDDASSYVDLSGEQLSVFQGTITSDGTANLDAAFDFDDLALDSLAYRSAFRSYMKKEYENRGMPERSKSLVAPTRSSPRQSPGQQSLGPLFINVPSDTESTIEESQAPNNSERVSSTPILVPAFDKAETTSGDSPDEISQSETRASSESAIWNTNWGGEEFVAILPRAYFLPTPRQDTTKSPDTELSVSLSAALDLGLIPDTEYYGTRPLGVLRIHIIGATNIRSSSFSRGKPNCFVRIIESGRVEGRTKVCKDNDAPEYDEMFYIPLIGIDSRLRLEVVESRRLLADQCLGFVDLGDLDDFLPGEPGNYRTPRTRRFPEMGQGLQTATGAIGGLLRFQLELYFSDRTAFRYPPRPSTVSVGQERLLASGEDQVYRSGLFTFSLELLDHPVNLLPSGITFYVFLNSAPFPAHIIDTRRDFGSQRFCFIDDLPSAKISIEVWKRGSVIGVAEKHVREWIMETRGWLGYPVEIRDNRSTRESQPIELEFKTCFLPVDTWTLPKDYSHFSTKNNRGPSRYLVGTTEQFPDYSE